MMMDRACRAAFLTKNLVDFGYNFETEKSNGSIFWETDLHYEDDESGVTKTLSTGPAFYFNHNDTIHSLHRMEVRPRFDHQRLITEQGTASSTTYTETDLIKVGIG